MSDEDEFKSAESKTPPSQKAGENSETTATVGATTTRYGGKTTSSQLNGKSEKARPMPRPEEMQMQPQTVVIQ